MGFHLPEEAKELLAHETYQWLCFEDRVIILKPGGLRASRTCHVKERFPAIPRSAKAQPVFFLFLDGFVREKENQGGKHDCRRHHEYPADHR